jgi:hypothetical protein
MASTPFRRLRRDLLAETMSMTRAQETAIAAQLLTHPVAKADPAGAAELATAFGFPAAFVPPAPGMASVLARLKG